MKGSIKRGDVVVYKNDALRTPMIVTEEPDEHGRTAHVWFPRRDWSNPSFGYCDSSAVELMEPVSTRVDTEFVRLVGEIEAYEIRFQIWGLCYSIRDSVLRVDVSTADRNTGEPIILTLTKRIPHGALPGDIYDLAFGLFKKVIVHELAEQLKVEGVRRDPHSEPPRHDLDVGEIERAWNRAASTDDKNRAHALAEWAHRYGIELLRAQKG